MPTREDVCSPGIWGYIVDGSIHCADHAHIRYAAVLTHLGDRVVPVPPVPDTIPNRCCICQCEVVPPGAEGNGRKWKAAT